MSKKSKGVKHVHAPAGIKPQPVRIPVKWLLLILALTAVAYLPSLNGSFVWDDARYIENNPLITTIDIKALFSRYVMGNYHPITMLVYALGYKLFALDPAGYHVVSLLIHLCNVLLVFYALFLLSRQVMPALVAALLFGIHPLHVESVAWASELKDLLYTFFFLASYIFYLKYVTKPGSKFYLFSLLLFLLSLLSKGMAVSLPVVLVLTDYFMGRKFSKQTIIEKIPFFALAIVFGVVAIYAQQSSSAIQEITRFPFLYRVVFASFGFVSYILKTILPIQLSAFYPYPVNSGQALPAFYYIFPLLALAILYTARFSKKIVFGLGFFTATVFLVLQLLPVGDAVMADRYSYVPSIGLFYLAAEGLNWLWQHNRKTPAIGLVAVFSVFFFAQTFTRGKVWKDGLTLWTDVIEKHPDVPVAYNNRGGALMHEKRFDEALADYNKAIELRPGFYDAYNNRGLLQADRHRTGEALDDYNKAIQSEPNHPEVYSNRGLLLMELKRNQEAWADFNKAIALKPDYSQAYYNRGLLASSEGKKQEAYNDYEKAIQLNPGYPEAHINRGVLLHNDNKLDEALAEYNIGVELQPENPQVHYNRGLVMMVKKRYDEAIRDFSKAIELNNGYAAAYYSRGMTNIDAGRKDAACPDLQTALKMGFQPAQEAVQNFCR